MHSLSVPCDLLKELLREESNRFELFSLVDILDILNVLERLADKAGCFCNREFFFFVSAVIFGVLEKGGLASDKSS